jgi:Uncharacterized conserved protein (COG2071)
MRLRGVIRRRLLVNFRVDPDVMQRQLPAPFRPKLHDGTAVAGVCLIRLEQIRPRWAPAAMGIASENAAHRVAVTWADEEEGVYIPRRDTSSLINRVAGGRLFPGEHSAATFAVQDDGETVELQMRSRDGETSVAVRGRAATALPATSRFASLDEASAFFERGSVGYSPGSGRLDGIRLVTTGWAVTPLDVEHLHSSFFSDTSRFPAGSVEFDCALVMRDVDHEWEAAGRIYDT